MFTIKIGDIYKLILGFQHCQVVRVRLIALEHDFALAMGISALYRTICVLERIYFKIGQIFRNINL